jgi:RNase H-fold protein (predicted Holliday junction resolvase)
VDIPDDVDEEVIFLGETGPNLEMEDPLKKEQVKAVALDEIGESKASQLNESVEIESGKRKAGNAAAGGSIKKPRASTKLDSMMVAMKLGMSKSSQSSQSSSINTSTATIEELIQHTVSVCDEGQSALAIGEASAAKSYFLAALSKRRAVEILMEDPDSG